MESSPTCRRTGQCGRRSDPARLLQLRTARPLGRKFDVINASGVFFHLEELHSVTEGIRDCLADDGVFVVQFLYMRRSSRTAFDQIYHEHLLYYNLANLETALAPPRPGDFRRQLSPIHGGSIIAYVSSRRGRAGEPSWRSSTRPEGPRREQCLEHTTFAARIEASEEENLTYLAGAKPKETDLRLGRPVKGNTLLNTLASERRRIDVPGRAQRVAARALFARHAYPDRIEKEFPSPPTFITCSPGTSGRDPAAEPGLVDGARSRVLFPDQPERSTAMKIAITGATGFLGTSLNSALSDGRARDVGPAPANRPHRADALEAFRTRDTTGFIISPPGRRRATFAFTTPASSGSLTSRSTPMSWLGGAISRRRS